MSYVLRHTMRFQATTLDGTIVIDLASRYSLQIRLFTFRSRKAATFTIIMLSINKMSSNLDMWKKHLRSFFLQTVHTNSLNYCYIVTSTSLISFSITSNMFLIDNQAS